MNSVCPECRREILGDQRFCRYCGALIPGVAPAVPPQVQPANRRARPWLVVGALCLVAAGILVWKLIPRSPWNPQLALSVSPLEITRGQQCTLTWSAANAESLSLNGELVPNKGSRSESPVATVTYRLVASGPGGKSESREITIRVVEPPASAPVIHFTGDRGHLTRGQSLTLTWSVTGATRIEIEPDVGVVGADGERRVAPQNNTDYKITTEGSGGKATDHFKVQVDAARPPKPGVAQNPSPAVQSTPSVAPSPPVITAFEAAPVSSVRQCDVVVLRWSVARASGVWLEGEPVSASAYKTIRLLRTATYVLKAEGPGGSVSQQVTVNVAPGNRSSCGK